ncbi:hypothetical protein D554_0028 [Bordetella holmesii 30539]|uniref:Uncharacterized protein n=2 Tax=Bordetella holmesii TaxID=35814 RepID=A0A158M529_9BORD|nr:hypothetical protein D560_0019 [Bordetella holmesii ATCC 51541]AIT24723.1 hypothetical protein D558_0022 [Bordetella holmesii 44057]EWM40250.1 hypothetical protein D556_3952 [Bordetella holmesii 41130]EWM45289.1 hypothetical protein D557_3284 [Bordetella holmesii 70147]EXF90228.1 hypothetical protein D554_0028 [Bordetella holmesii 30539]EXX94591.1 hypothetical protein D559_2006 [Bordetella holmesii 1058]KAK82578.1 hypothetical protein L496_1715 [Bordetella holmesii CDC-H572-BH]KAK83241.1 
MFLCSHPNVSKVTRRHGASLAHDKGWAPRPASAARMPTPANALVEERSAPARRAPEEPHAFRVAPETRCRLDLLKLRNIRYAASPSSGRAHHA